MLKLAGLASVRLPLTDTPLDLRGPLREATGQSFRRINRFIQLALLGAARCVASLERPPPPDCALMIGTDSGMLADMSRVVTAMAAEQRVPTPFEFMNVSGAMAGFQVAQYLGLRGPQLTVHAVNASLEAALRLLSLRSAPQRQALVGFIEEGCWPLHEQRERLDWPQGGIEECSHWLYFDADAIAPLATLQWCRRYRDLEALAAALEPLDRSTLVLAASRYSRNTVPLNQWAAQLGISRLSGQDDPVAHSGGLPAAAIGQLLREHPGRGLLYLNQSGEKEFHATLLDATAATAFVPPSAPSNDTRNAR